MPPDDPNASPADPLTRAQDAYAAGDFAALRADAAAASRSDDRDVANRALALASKVAIDPWVWAVLAICLALFCAIVVRYAL